MGRSYHNKLWNCKDVLSVPKNVATKEPVDLHFITGPPEYFLHKSPMYFS